MPRSLAKNSVANLFGGLLPSVASLLTIPFIVGSLGETQFGVLTMVTAVVGYFAVLDLNLTSGAIKYIAQYDAAGDRHAVNQVLSVGLIGYLILGSVGCGAIYWGSDVLVQKLFQLEGAQAALAGDAVRVAAFGFLLNQLQVFLLGVPQALQRYDISAILDTGFGVLTPVASVVVLVAGLGLYELVVLRVMLAAANVAILIVVVARLLPGWSVVVPSAMFVRTVGSFAGFSYLHRLSGLLYQWSDSLIIGAMLGMNALTYFVVPFTLANRVFGMALRLATVLLPAVSAMQARCELEPLKRVYLATARYLFFVNAGLFIFLGLFAREILYYWIGPEFAERGATVMTIVAASLLVDATTNAPALVNDGLGHPMVTGLFSLFRALLRIALTLLAAAHYGILGVAVSHVLSTTVYAALLLFYVHGRTVPCSLSELLRHAYRGIGLFGALVYGMVLMIRPERVLGLLELLAYAGGTGLALGLFGYAVVLRQTDRIGLNRRLGWRGGGI